MNKIIEAFIRHGLGWAGVVGTVELQNDLEQLAAAIVVVGTLAWSIREKIKASKKS